MIYPRVLYRIVWRLFAYMRAVRSWQMSSKDSLVVRKLYRL